MKIPGWICAGLLLATAALANPGEGSGDRVPASRDLNLFVTTEVGMITLSADGNGMMATSGFLQVQKPSAAATVRVAYLAAASTGFLNYSIPNGVIRLNDVPVSWNHTTPSGIMSYNHMGDVTAIVTPVMAAAGVGITNIPVTELNSSSIDGTALYVVFDDPATTVTRTAVLAFGAQATAGDNFSIGFGQPVFPDANTVVEFGLGISYGYARGTCQTSYVDVNGTRLTSSAGGNDEGENFNGALITVGGVGDSRTNPLSPMFNDPCSFTDYTTYDDELYNIASYISAGSTSMNVHTFNPSHDDNIFAATLLLDFAAVIGEGAVLTPATASSCIGDPQTLTLTLQNSLGNPLVNYAATIDITSGPHAGYTASGTTNTLGQFSTTYTGTAPGTDNIRGSFLNSSGVLQYSNLASMSWEDCQVSESGSLSPSVATLCTGGNHTVVLSLQDGNGSPLVGFNAGILVISGPHAGTTTSGLTNGAGQLSLSYTGTTVGVDALRGSFTNSNGILEYTSLVHAVWQQCTVTEIATLSPALSSSCLGVPYTVTLTMEDDNGNLLPDYPVTLEIISGPNAGLTASGLTDVNGEFFMTYVSAVVGTDTILGTFTNSSGVPDESNQAVNTWQGCNTGGWGEVTPVFSTGCMGDDFTAVMTLRGGSGNPLINYPATFEVFEGPNMGVSVSGTTDSNGQMFLTYTSSVIGNDKLRGIFFDEFNEERETNEAEREWLDCSLAAPVIVLENSSPCNAVITWDPIPGAASYDVWTSPGMGQPWTQETNTANPFYSIGCVNDLPVMQLYRVTASSN